jgi:hypothetical protein
MQTHFVALDINSGAPSGPVEPRRFTHPPPPGTKDANANSGIVTNVTLERGTMKCHLGALRPVQEPLRLILGFRRLTLIFSGALINRSFPIRSLEFMQYLVYNRV